MCLEEKTEKTKCTLMSHHQNVGQNYSTKIANRSYEKVTKLNYMSVTEIKIIFMQKGMLAAIQFSNFCLPTRQRNVNIHTYNYNFSCVFMV
jgi:hypothetical protein